jgi:hypothetical protein
MGNSHSGASGVRNAPFGAAPFEAMPSTGRSRDRQLQPCLVVTLFRVTPSPWKGHARS